MKSTTNQRYIETCKLQFCRCLHSFSCCCFPNLRNPTKFYENSTKIRTYSSSRSSKVIDLGVNRKRICNFPLVTNSNYGRMSDRFRDIGALSSKSLFFPPQLLDAPYRRNALQYHRNITVIYTPLKSRPTFNGLQFHR